MAGKLRIKDVAKIIMNEECSDDDVNDKDYSPSDSDEQERDPLSPQLLRSKAKASDINEANRSNDRIFNGIQNDCNDVDSNAEACNTSVKNTSEIKRIRSEREKLERDLLSHPMKNSCLETCKKGCTKVFGNDERKQFHSQFWSLNFNERRNWMWQNIQQAPTTRPKSQHSRRKNTFVYRFRRSAESGGGFQEVCKTFFLSTLGYNPKSDGAFMRCLKSAPPEAMIPENDKRGKHQPINKKDKDQIYKHIRKYNPAVHHYRREHAPNRLYLPSDITVAKMHADYIATEEKISTETYRKCVKEMNISFAVLGQEECEDCKAYLEHKKSHKPDEEVTEECERCSKNEEHLRLRNEARIAYQRDVQTNKENNDTNTYYGSVDLQKVIMLPRMNGVKTCAFTRRIIAFNETFAELGKAKNNSTVVWNESVSGRSAADICSAFWCFFTKKLRDTKQIVLWCDNCTSQNKNWTMYTFLVMAVNSEKIAVDSIELRYLVSGHTFMSADSVHHQIELSMKKHGDVCDWEEFKEVLSKAKCQVLDIDANDFVKFYDGSSRVRISKTVPRVKLNHMSAVRFERGSKLLKYKTTHSVEAQYHSLDFLKSKVDVSEIPPACTSPRGVPPPKREDIVKKLCPLMPTNRREFWIELPCSSSSKDLIDVV